jgi:serine/threonine protein kinase
VPIGRLLNGGTLGHHLCLHAASMAGPGSREEDTGCSSVCQDDEASSGAPSASGKVASRPRSWAAIASSELLQLATDVASGLHYLHANGVTHLDVKNANVMVDRGRAQTVRAKLCDFGISFLKSATTDDLHPAHHHPTQRSFSSIGTTRYLAPEMTQLLREACSRYVPSEQLEVVQHVRVDVYSFGLMLHEIMHGRIFFGAHNPMVASMKCATGQRPPVELRPEHEHFADLISACWDAAAERRPTMEKVVEALSTGVWRAAQT